VSFQKLAEGTGCSGDFAGTVMSAFGAEDDALSFIAVSAANGEG